MRRTFFVSCILLWTLANPWTHGDFCQEVEKDYFPTPNTKIGATPDAKKQGEKKPNIRYLITNDTKETLAGNLCFEEATASMGFQYIAIPKGQPLNKNEFSRWWHNAGVKFMLTLKNGPFWKSKVNRKFKECRFGSGDYVG